MRRLKPTEPERLQTTGLSLVGLLAMVFWVSLFASNGVTQAGGFRPPQECQGSTGETHLHCLYGYIDMLEENAGKVDEAFNKQKKRLEHPEQIDRQASAADEMEQNLADRTDAPQPANSTLASSHPSVAASAPSFRSPQECRAYTGDAHLNCLYAYIEMQQSKTGRIEEELKTQKGMLGQLREQIDRQAAASSDVQRRLDEGQATTPPPAVYVQPPVYPGYFPGYYYPSPGLSFFFGVPRYYYGYPFYGPRFYGPRFYGPRFYGGGYFGRRR